MQQHSDTERPRRSDEVAMDDLRMRLTAIKEVGGGRKAADAATAQNVLREELGDFGSYEKRYNLSDETRDILLAHGRQDAAHAAIATASLQDALAAIRFLLMGIVALLIVLIAVIALR